MTTNNAGNFGTGTSGQVLTSNGAGVSPTFQTITATGLTLKLNYDAINQAINSSFNVASVTHLASGRCRINFTSAYGNTNYVCVMTSSDLVPGRQARNTL